MSPHTSVITIVRKYLPYVRNSTPIIAYICLRLDIASPQHLDRSLFAFVICLFTGGNYAAVFAFNVATPTARTPRPPRAPLCGKLYMVNCKQQKAMRAVVEW